MYLYSTRVAGGGSSEGFQKEVPMIVQYIPTYLPNPYTFVWGNLVL